MKIAEELRYKPENVEKKVIVEKYVTETVLRDM